MEAELKERAIRNKLIFDRAIALLKQVYSLERSEVLDWLNDDEEWKVCATEKDGEITVK